MLTNNEIKKIFKKSAKGNYYAHSLKIVKDSQGIWIMMKKNWYDTNGKVTPECKEYLLMIKPLLEKHNMKGVDFIKHKNYVENKCNKNFEKIIKMLKNG